FQLEPGDDGLPRPIGVMGGSLLVSSALIFDPSSPDGVHRITATLYRYDLEGHRLATLGEILDAERYVRSDENAPSVRFTLPLREEYAGRDRWRPFLPCPPVDLPDRAVHERGEARSA